MFDQAFLDKQKQRLEQRRDALLKDLGGVSRPDADHRAPGDFEPLYPNMGDDDEDNAAELAQFESNISAESTLEETLHQVKVALANIEAGTYGKCSNCDSEVSQPRLEALPEATLCLDCAKK